MIAAGVVDNPEARTRNRGDQQKQTDELEQQTPRLLDPAAVLKLCADIGADPESESGDYLVALGSIEEIKRDDSCGDPAHQAEKFTEI